MYTKIKYLEPPAEKFATKHKDRIAKDINSLIKNNEQPDAQSRNSLDASFNAKSSNNKFLPSENDQILEEDSDNCSSRDSDPDFPAPSNNSPATNSPSTGSPNPSKNAAAASKLGSFNTQ